MGELVGEYGNSIAEMTNLVKDVKEGWNKAGNEKSERAQMVKDLVDRGISTLAGAACHKIWIAVETLSPVMDLANAIIDTLKDK